MPSTKKLWTQNENVRQKLCQKNIPMFHFILFHLGETKKIWNNFAPITAELKYQPICRRNAPDFHLQTLKDVHQSAAVLR